RQRRNASRIDPSFSPAWRRRSNNTPPLCPPSSSGRSDARRRAVTLSGTNQQAQSEEQIHAARIGGAQPLEGGRIILVEYDPAWPALYERETMRVRAVLGAQVRLLEHVGSTSVPGLMAKPIVDILLAVPDSADEAAYVPP